MLMARIAIVLTVALISVGSAQARSTNLWAEKQSSQVPLAQVPDFSALASQAMPAVVSIDHVEKQSTPLLRGLPL